MCLLENQVQLLIFDPPTVSDNCDGLVLENLAALDSGDIFPVGTTTITYQATDVIGNTASCLFTVTITEESEFEAPVITNCPSDIVLSNDLGECTAIVNWTAPEATDNSGEVELISNFAPGDTLPVGTTTVTYTASDPSDNTSTCSFNVTIEDTELPRVFCSSNITRSILPELSTIIVNFADPIYLDNCPGATLEQVGGLPSGSAFPIGVTTNVFRVTDATGNVDSCSFMVTVTNQNVLQITGLSDIVQDNDQDSCGATITLPLPQYANAVGLIEDTTSLNIDPGESYFFPVGNTEVIYEATDVSTGQIARDTITVTINDRQAPSIVCIDDVFVEIPANNQSITFPYPTPTFSDNCSGAVIEQTGGLF